ncbi:MAG: hypothetical protein M0P17_11590 [Methanoculleus sp.]|nr:hypothetical protein [Methanoculleus sp.]
MSHLFRERTDDPVLPEHRQKEEDALRGIRFNIIFTGESNISASPLLSSSGPLQPPSGTRCGTVASCEDDGRETPCLEIGTLFERRSWLFLARGGCAV